MNPVLLLLPSVECYLLYIRFVYVRCTKDFKNTQIFFLWACPHLSLPVNHATTFQDLAHRCWKAAFGLGEWAPACPAATVGVGDVSGLLTCHSCMYSVVCKTF